MGRISKDPEIKTGNTTVANFSIAVDRKYKKDGEPTADFFNCVSFGKQAEFVEKYLKKGTKVVITGRLQNDSYTNKDGQKVTFTKTYVEEIEFAESKSKKEEKDDYLSVPDDIGDLPF